MIFAPHDQSLSYSYNLGRICGWLFLAAVVVAVFQSRLSGQRVFSSAAKYLLAVVVLIVAGMVALTYTHRQGTTGTATEPQAAAFNADPVATLGDAPASTQDPELARPLAEAQRQYNALAAQRATLDTKNTKAVQAFNQQASAYQELLKRIAERQKTASSRGTTQLQ